MLSALACWVVASVVISVIVAGVMILRRKPTNYDPAWTDADYFEAGLAVMLGSYCGGELTNFIYRGRLYILPTYLALSATIAAPGRRRVVPFVVLRRLAHQHSNQFLWGK